MDTFIRGSVGLSSPAGLDAVIVRGSIANSRSVPGGGIRQWSSIDSLTHRRCSLPVVAEWEDKGMSKKDK